MLPDNNINFQIGQPKSTSSNSLKAMDVLVILVSHWYWFVLSIGLCLAIAEYSIRITRPLYTRVAAILIKQEGKNGSLDEQSMEALGLKSFSADVNNEVFALKSPVIMEEVVNRLKLQYRYDVEGVFHAETLYGPTLPIKVDIPEVADNEEVTFTIKFNKDASYEVTNIVRNGVPTNKAVAGQLGKTYKSVLGPFKISKTEAWYMPDRNIYFTHERRQYTLNNYLSKLQVVPNGTNSTIINLAYVDLQPQRAEEILATVIAVYNENWVKDRNRVSISTDKFINDRLQVIEKELGSVENDISGYRSANLIPGSSNDVGAAYLNNVNEAEQQLTQINQELYLTRYVRQYLANDVNRYQLIPAHQGITNANISGLINDYNTKLMRRNGLISTSSAQNPLVQDLDNELDVLRSALIGSIDNYINTLNVQSSTTLRVKAVNTGKVAASPIQNKYLLSVERQQKVKESLYLFLLQKREENELSQAFIAYNTRVIQPPTGSNAPTSPVSRNYYLIALLLGLVLPTALLLLREILNSSIRGRKDIESLTIPFVGEIPMINPPSKFKVLCKNIRLFFMTPKQRRRQKEDKTLHILVKDNSRNVINEAFRVIRTNLEFMAGRGEGGRTIMLTSFNPNSGKTFVVCNLGVALNIKKKRVCMVDLDMRKRSLSAFVEKPKYGLSDYLGGYIEDFHDIVMENPEYPGLSVIPVGTLPPNPTELLFEPTLEKLTTELRKEYDYIFLDCPPVEVVADASIVSRYADMTLFIIRAEILERAALPELQRYYDEQRLPKMATILNGTTDAFSRYGYHRYGSRYGYSYGYGHHYSGYAEED